VAVHETMAMDKAVEMALSLVDIEDTLIIVTADHGHTMSMGGYQTRGADIRGIQEYCKSLEVSKEIGQFHLSRPCNCE
jgi:alkaline phosphatase